MKEKLLKTPQGTETIFLEEAYKHEKITEELNGLFTSWGYLPVKTPVFDYYDAYGKLLDEKRIEQCFRLMDRDGELLLLRNDITLFVARQMGRILNENDLPVRVHYSDIILRHQPDLDISSDEFFQAGCELIGKKGMDGDLEIITLLYNVIESLNLPETRIHLGSRALFNRLTEDYKELKHQELIELIESREKKAIHSYLLTFMNDETAKTLTDLFLFIGTIDEFSSLAEKKADFLKLKGCKEIVESLIKMGDQLKKMNMENTFRIDLSEVGNQPYYTGIVFNAYTAGMDTAIASGGRYDNLISRFGKDIPSVGFSLLLRKIESAVHSEKFNPPAPEVQTLDKEFSESYKEAQKLRAEGKAVILEGDK